MRISQYLFFALILLVSQLGSSWAETRGACSRVVSLAPSVSEIFAALGLEEKLVGVSQYSDFPASLKSIPRVGGFLDINFEFIVSLKPSLIVALEDSRDKSEYLKSLGYEVLILEHRNLAGILSSIESIGKACGYEDKAHDLKFGIQGYLEKVKLATQSLVHPRVMVVIGESSRDGGLGSLFLSGADGFYSDILKIVGAQNVLQDKTLGVSTLSAEGVIVLDPDIVIEILPSVGELRVSREAAMAAWRGLESLRVVREKKIFLLDADYISVPGPRLVNVVSDFLRAVHPGVALEADNAS